MDALSEVLQSVKLSGALFFCAECTAPWCVSAAASDSFVPYLPRDATHVIEFHLVTHGRGYIRVGGETTPFSAGDILMMPHGDAHVMGNGTGVDPIDGSVVLPGILAGEFAQSRIGGGGEMTRFICGYLACEAGLIRPVLVGLPRVLRVHIRNDASGEWLENSIVHAVERAGAAEPGSSAIVARLAEVVFAEALQRYLNQLPSGQTGWLAGVGDPAVGRCLAVLHRRPSHSWTLDQLAEEASVSRSALTQKFSQLLGESPMAYLAAWRLELGADSLRSSSRSVVQVAAEVGYESEASFNRAFKRRFGKPPAQYRRSHREARKASAEQKHAARNGHG